MRGQMVGRFLFFVVYLRVLRTRTIAAVLLLVSILLDLSCSPCALWVVQSEWQDERPPAPSYLRILYLGKILQDDDTLSSKHCFPHGCSIISDRSFADL